MIRQWVANIPSKYIDRLLIQVNLYLEEIMSYSLAKLFSADEPTN